MDFVGLSLSPFLFVGGRIEVSVGKGQQEEIEREEDEIRLVWI